MTKPSEAEMLTAGEIACIVSDASVGILPEPELVLTLCNMARASLRAQTATKVVAEWMIANGLVTGHGDTLEDLLAEAAAQIHAPVQTATAQPVAIEDIDWRGEIDAASPEDLSDYLFWAEALTKFAIHDKADIVTLLAIITSERDGVDALPAPPDGGRDG